MIEKQSVVRSTPMGRKGSVLVQLRRFQLFPGTFRSARRIRREAGLTFEEAWRLAWIREHRLPLGYTASVLSTYRAAGNRLRKALDIEVSGARGRNLARVRTFELSRSMGMPPRVSDSASESGLIDVTGLISAMEALGWETLDSPHGGIRVGLNQEAVGFHECLAGDKDFWLVWTEGGHWAWGTARSDGILTSTTMLNTVTDNPKATAAAVDAVLRGVV